MDLEIPEKYREYEVLIKRISLNNFFLDPLWEQTIEWVYGDLYELHRVKWLEDPRHYVDFHGYKIYFNGLMLSKRGKPLAHEFRPRKGGREDIVQKLSYANKPTKWTASRLIAACWLGPIHGYEINHNDRDIWNNHALNLSRMTPSENQIHWRKAESDKDK